MEISVSGVIDGNHRHRSKREFVTADKDSACTCVCVCLRARRVNRVSGAFHSWKRRRRCSTTDQDGIAGAVFLFFDERFGRARPPITCEAK